MEMARRIWKANKETLIPAVEYARRNGEEDVVIGMFLGMDWYQYHLDEIDKVRLDNEPLPQ